MRILMISKALPQSFKGGIQTHVWELSRALIKRGHEVSIVTAGSMRRGVTHHTLEGIQIYEIPHLSYYYIPIIPHTVSEISFNIAAVRWIEQNAEKFDIVHTHGRSGYLYPSVKKRKLPCVTTVHRLYATEMPWSKKEYKNALDRKLHLFFVNRFEKRSLKYAGAIIAISQEIIRQLATIDAPKDKIHLIYNGVSTDTLVRQYPPIGNQLLFVGRLTAIKGTHLLIESMRNVRQDIHLKILGDGMERPLLEQLIERLGLQNRVELLGQQPIEAVFHHLSQSYALILPSYHESQGIVLMEANLAGKPTLGSDAPGIQEMIVPGKNGYLFEVGNVDAMTAAINQLFQSPAKAAQMGAWGREWVINNFSWNKIAQEVEALYEAQAIPLRHYNESSIQIKQSNENQ